MENLERQAKELATFLDNHNLPESQLNLVSLSHTTTPKEMGEILKLASKIESQGQGADLEFKEAGYSRCLPEVRIGGPSQCHDESRTVVNLSQEGSSTRIGQFDGDDEFKIVDNF